MLKARADDANGNPIFLFGLTEENVRRMREGEMLRVDLAQMGGHGTIHIMVGKDIEALRDFVMQFVGPDTTVSVDPALRLTPRAQ